MESAPRLNQPARTAGFTLLELLVAMLIAAILISSASQVLSGWLPRERVSAASNQVLGLIWRARLRASQHGPVLLCDGQSRCDHFGITDHLLLADDPDEDGHIDDRDIVEHLHLPPGTTLTWVRFRGQALHYGRRGTLFYQNGHFLICNRGYARSVIMTVIGTTRVAAADAQDCPET